MALPALQDALNHLTAVSREHAEGGAHAGDVVSFPMAKIINLVDAAIAREESRRRRLIEASRFLAEALADPAGLQADDLDEYAEFLTQLKRALRDFSRPYFATVEGEIALAQVARDLRSSLLQAADERLARRQAERIDACLEACEARRMEFVTIAERIVAFMETEVAGNGPLEDALKRAIGRRSVDRYPVINAFLAR